MAANQLPSTLASCRLAFVHRKKKMYPNQTNIFIYFEHIEILLLFRFVNTLNDTLLI